MTLNILPEAINEYLKLDKYSILCFLDPENIQNQIIQSFIKIIIINWKKILCLMVKWSEFITVFQKESKRCNPNDLLIIGCGKIMYIISNPIYRNIVKAFEIASNANNTIPSLRPHLAGNVITFQYDFLLKPIKNLERISHRLIDQDPENEINLSESASNSLQQSPTSVNTPITYFNSEMNIPKYPYSTKDCYNHPSTSKISLTLKSNEKNVNKSSITRKRNEYLLRSNFTCKNSPFLIRRTRKRLYFEKFKQLAFINAQRSPLKKFPDHIQLSNKSIKIPFVRKLNTLSSELILSGFPKRRKYEIKNTSKNT